MRVRYDDANGGERENQRDVLCACLCDSRRYANSHANLSIQYSTIIKENSRRRSYADGVCLLAMRARAKSREREEEKKVD